MAEEKVLDDNLNEEQSDETLKEKENKDQEELNEDSEQPDENLNNAEENKENPKELSTLVKCLIVFLFPGLLVLFFLISGFVFEGAWRMNWLLFLGIPVYWSGLYAYYKRNFLYFLFPLLVIGVYLFIGLAFPNNKGWHPYWLILLEIPLYYVAVYLVKNIAAKKAEQEKEEVEEEEEPVIIDNGPVVLANDLNIDLQNDKEETPAPDVKNIVLKEKHDISQVTTEKRNFNKDKRKVKIKADIVHHHEEDEESNE